MGSRGKVSQLMSDQVDDSIQAFIEHVLREPETVLEISLDRALEVLDYFEKDRDLVRRVPGASQAVDLLVEEVTRRI